MQKWGHPLLNLSIHIGDAMDGLNVVGQFTHVFSTAMTGPRFYTRVRAIAAGGMAILLKEMWEGTIPRHNRVRTVYLCGPGGARKLVAGAVPRRSGRGDA